MMLTSETIDTQIMALLQLLLLLMVYHVNARPSWGRKTPHNLDSSDEKPVYDHTEQNPSMNVTPNFTRRNDMIRRKMYQTT